MMSRDIIGRNFSSLQVCACSGGQEIYNQQQPAQHCEVRGIHTYLVREHSKQHL